MGQALAAVPVLLLLVVLLLGRLKQVGRHVAGIHEGGGEGGLEGGEGCALRGRSGRMRWQRHSKGCCFTSPTRI